MSEEDNHSESENSGLEDDDRELLQESFGKSGFRRLRHRNQTIDEDDEILERRKRVAPEELEKLFDEESKDSEKKSFKITDNHALFDESEDDLADFIEEDESDAETLIKRPPKSTQTSDSTPKRLKNRAQEIIYEIFGDGSEYDGLVAEDDSSALAPIGGTSRRVLDSNVSSTKSKFSDQKISNDYELLLQKDIPERMATFQSDTNLEDEAIWITKKLLRSEASRRLEKVDLNLLVDTVEKVLRLYCVSLWEVPVVATHRKEIYKKASLSLPELWAIWDLHSQWIILHRQKQIVSSLFIDEESLIDLLHHTDDLETVLAIADYVKNSKNRSLNGSAPAMQLIENLKADRLVNQLSPNMENALYYASNPHSRRAIRSLLEDEACVTTSLIKDSRAPINPYEQEIYQSAFLTSKPIYLFDRTADYLMIEKGRAAGIVSVKVDFPRLESVIKRMSSSFTSENSSQKYSRNEPNRRDVEKGLNFDFASNIIKLIVPKLQRDIEARLLKEAQSKCVSTLLFSLQDRLMGKPYENFKDESQKIGDGKVPIRVLVLSEESMVVVDRTGAIYSHAQITDVGEELENHLDSKISCVLICGVSSKIFDIYKSAKKVSKSKGIDLYYGVDDCARVYCVSKRASREYPELTVSERYCLSVGRRWINPLFEIANLASNSDSEHLAVQYSRMIIPKAMMISDDLIMDTVRRSLINVVNLVGVRIDELRTVWQRSVLSYVTGLGSHSSMILLKSISNSKMATNLNSTGVPETLNTANESNFKGEDKGIKSRSDLWSIFGPRIASNCASSLRFPNSKNPLDKTRIHPDNYKLALRMAADAMDIDAADDEENDNALVLQVMKEAEKLDELLLDDFADELVKRGQEPKHQTLNDIRFELGNPYHDLRTTWVPISDRVILWQLAGCIHLEPGMYCEAVVCPQSFVDSDAHGSLKCRVIARGSHKLALLLPASDVKKTANFDHTMGLDVNLEEVPRKISFKKSNSSVIVKIVSVEGLLIRAKIVDPIDFVDFVYSSDRYHDRRRVRESLVDKPNVKDESVPKKIGEKIHPNISKHPLFALNKMMADEMLGSGQLGDFCVRPSLSRGSKHATLTWRIDDDGGKIAMFQNLDLALHEASITVDGETFESIDEIVVRYVEPMASILREVCGTPKYLAVKSSHVSGAIKEIEDHLHNLIRKSPDRIPYTLTLDRKRPGHVLLSVLMPGKAEHERVEVVPTGLRFRGRFFKRISDLVEHFKKSFNPVVPPRTENQPLLRR